MKFFGKVIITIHNKNANPYKNKPRFAIIYISLDDKVKSSYISFNFKGMKEVEQKYKINGNIKCLNKKFLASGKFSITFNYPHISVYIETSDIEKANIACDILLNHYKDPNHIDENNELIKLYSQNQIASHLKMCQCEITITPKNYKKDILHYGNNIQKLKVISILDSDKFLRPLYKFKLLTNLTITQCELSSLPSFTNLLEDSGLMTQLLYLDLSQNKIQYLPPLLFNTQIPMKLQYLNLSYNVLTHLPNTLFIYLSNSLLHLYLNNNYLEFIPNNVGKLKYLRTLCMENNRIKVMPFSLLACQHLQKCYINQGNFFYPDILEAGSSFDQNIYNRKKCDQEHYLIVSTLQDIVLKYSLTNRVLLRNKIPLSLQYYIDYECEMCMCDCPFIPANINLACYNKTITMGQLSSHTIDMSSKCPINTKEIFCDKCLSRTLANG